jgi:DhnA family fructose-bisphosphate aldolase class Ia
MRGKEIRLARLFANGAKPVVVAVDHGQTFGPMSGLIDFSAAVVRLKEADGVLMAPQMIRFSEDLYSGKNNPAVIARLNWNTIHCEPWNYQDAHIVKGITVRTAVACGADFVIASLVLKTGSEKNDAQNVEGFVELAEQSRELGIPFIGEVFAIPGMRNTPSEFHDYIKKTCRIVCELGADAVKTFYTGERFAEVTGAVPVPVLALGAEKLACELDALELAFKAVDAGARGVVFGRNVVQARDPAQFLRALKKVVQHNVSPVDAAMEHGIAAVRTPE